MTLLWTALERHAAGFKAGYLRELQRVGKLENGYLEIEPDQLVYIKSGFAETTTLQPSDWPLWAKAMRLLSRPADKGLGDTVARIVGPIGGDAFKAWHLATFGVPCGCAGRQEALNAQYPYPLEAVSTPR